MRLWPWSRRRPAPAPPVRETLPWHDEGVAGDFKRAAVQLVAEVVDNDELSPEAGARLFDVHARHLFGISGEEWLRRWDSGEITWDSHPGATSVAMLIPFVRPVSG